MQVNYTGLLGPLRWGVGKLVCDARKYTDRCGARWCAVKGWVHLFIAVQRCLVPNWEAAAHAP